ncbi:hypothetical protein K710_0054 [Streptococcus iniae SF1]|nr:hypothetical protein K710_0054 [Streptococcus iniae SF1]EKB52174.1 hypothetical protein A0G_0009 [Streptococcus iniae 9117]ESR10007.1 hypothetical protein IUSA1_03930 [Streptococcus iniae IUSA1]
MAPFFGAKNCYIVKIAANLVFSLTGNRNAFSDVMDNAMILLT